MTTAIAGEAIDKVVRMNLLWWRKSKVQEPRALRQAAWVRPKARRHWPSCDTNMPRAAYWASVGMPIECNCTGDYSQEKLAELMQPWIDLEVTRQKMLVAFQNAAERQWYPDYELDRWADDGGQVSVQTPGRIAIEGKGVR